MTERRNDGKTGRRIDGKTSKGYVASATAAEPRLEPRESDAGSQVTHIYRAADSPATAIDSI